MHDIVNYKERLDYVNLLRFPFLMYKNAISNRH